MTKLEKDLLARVAELEKKVKELEARPAIQYHYHYTQPTPYYVPQPYIVPQYTTWPTWSPSTTWGTNQATTTVAQYDASVPHTLTS